MKPSTLYPMLLYPMLIALLLCVAPPLLSAAKVGEAAPEFGDEFGRPARQRANLGAGLAVTDGTARVGDMNRD